MTQFEVMDLWLSHMTFLMSQFLAFISGTSAFLIVATTKGRDLPEPLYKLVLSLYVVATLFFILFYGKVSEGIFNLRTQMRELGMEWYNVVYEPQLILPIILVLGFIIMLSLAVGSVWYFSSLRRSMVR